MKYLAKVFHRAAADDAEPPATPFAPGPYADLGDDDEPSADGRSVQLFDAFCVIDYEDAQARRTRRRVTMLRLSAGLHGPIIAALCHERRAIRRFRADRILGVIVDDGEVIPLGRYLSEVLWLTEEETSLLDDQPTAVPRAPRKIAEPDPFNVLRDRLAAPLALLVAAAKSDGEFHIAELDEIELYVEVELVALHREGLTPVIPTLEVAQRLQAPIRFMRPRRASIPGFLLEIAEWDQAAQARVARSLARLVAADGEIVEAEIAFANELADLTEAAAIRLEG